MQKEYYKKVILSEGEEYCEYCNGTGSYKDYDNCPKCLGTGKFDWIEKVIGKKERKSTSYLNQINVERMVSYVRKTIEDNLEETIFNENALEVAKHNIIQTLDNLKNHRKIYDYQFDLDHLSIDELSIDVQIKPRNTAEIVKINTVIQNRKI